MKHCIDCQHFMRHREVVRGPYWSDELEEVDSIYGDCRAHAPVASWWRGHSFPVVTTGHGCSEFKERATG